MTTNSGFWGWIGEHPAASAMAKTSNTAKSATISVSGIHVSVAASQSKDRSVLYRTEQAVVTIDGDIGMHLTVPEVLSRLEDDKFTLHDAVSRLQEEGQGAVFLARIRPAEVLVAPGHLGGYSLYYAMSENGVIFSSIPTFGLLSPGFVPDPAGIVHYMRDGHLTGTRTLFQNVKQLLPGQFVTLGPNQKPSVIKERTWWSAYREPCSDLESAEEEFWSSAVDTASLAAPPGHRVAVMLSGGWDSRTVLGALVQRHDKTNVVAYSHGNPRSRELAIAENLANITGVQWEFRRLTANDYSRQTLDTCFDGSCTTLFPPWYIAAQHLKALGVDVATSGVYGELMGGRIEPKFFKGGKVRKTDEIRCLFGAFPRAWLYGTADRKAFQIPSLPVPWVLHPDALGDIDFIRGEINRDILELVDHIEEQGVKGLETIEILSMLTRSGGYTNGQVRSLRCVLPSFDISTGARTLRALGSIPVTQRLNNSLNRRVLARHAPELLQLPVAASLVRASRPIYLQQLMRIVRRLGGDIGHELYHRLAWAKVKRPQLGWVDFSFLHQSGIFEAIIASLQSDMWNRKAMLETVAGVSQSNAAEKLHSLMDMFLKVLDVDRTLSGVRSGTAMDSNN